MELGRSLDWQICRARPTQDAIREAGRTPEHGIEVGSIGHRPPFSTIHRLLENRRKPARAHELRDTRGLSGKDWRRGPTLRVCVLDDKGDQDQRPALPLLRSRRLCFQLGERVCIPLLIVFAFACRQRREAGNRSRPDRATRRLRARVRLATPALNPHREALASRRAP